MLFNIMSNQIHENQSFHLTEQNNHWDVQEEHTDFIEGIATIDRKKIWQFVKSLQNVNTV